MVLTPQMVSMASMVIRARHASRFSMYSDACRACNPYHSSIEFTFHMITKRSPWRAQRATHAHWLWHLIRPCCKRLGSPMHTKISQLASYIQELELSGGNLCLCGLLAILRADLSPDGRYLGGLTLCNSVVCSGIQ